MGDSHDTASAARSKEHGASRTHRKRTVFDATVRDADQLEMLEDLFFRNIHLPNGTFKTTYRRRLDDLNALVRSHLPPRRPLDCMDVAVSSGVSTLEWIEFLAESGVQCRMTAGDAQVHAYLAFDRQQAPCSGRSQWLPAAI